MTVADWVMVLVVLLSPLLAVQVTRRLDERKEARARKLTIFKVLMATRASRVSAEHVQALNLIDLEFDRTKGKDKEVIEAWKAYHDHLGDTAYPSDQWGVRLMDLLIELLYAMAKNLRYDFDKTHIKTSVYMPRAHGELEDDQQIIRRCFREVLECKRVIPMYVTNLPPQPAPEAEAQSEQPAQG